MDPGTAGAEDPATAGPVHPATDPDTAMGPATDTTAPARGYHHLCPSGYRPWRAGADHTYSIVACTAPARSAVRKPTTDPRTSEEGSSGGVLAERVGAENEGICKLGCADTGPIWTWTVGCHFLGVIC